MLPVLSGLRVLDLTTVIYGPLIGQLLGDLGAEVIKVEGPEGDLARTIQPRGPTGDSAMFVCNNRNKRGMVLDLKTQAGRDVFDRLIGWSEVFLHNMRPQAIDRLGYGFAKGAAIGLSDVHTRVHLYRAIIEGINHCLYTGMRKMEKRAKLKIMSLYVAGGGAQSAEIC